MGIKESRRRHERKRDTGAALRAYQSSAGASSAGGANISKRLLMYGVI